MSETEVGAKRRNQGALDRVWPIPSQLNWELVAYGTLIALALVLRLWDLGSRMLHHDESLHATYSWYLYIGRGYRHDPLMHGPFLFHLNALIYLLFGVSDATARLAPALFGTAIVGLPYFLRDRIGRTPALVAAALLVVSPSFLYFSRFIRNDIYSATWTLALVILIFKYLDNRRNLYLYLLAAILSLSYATKEIAFISSAILAAYLFILAGFEPLKLLVRNSRLSPPSDLLIIFGTFTLPQATAFALKLMPVLSIPPAEEYRFLGVVFVVLFAISAAIGLRWNPRVWLWSALIFWGIFTVLFTTLFSNPQGFATGAVGALKYWLDQQGVARGGQPWFYYLVLIPLYEFVPVIFGLAAMVYFLAKRHRFAAFLTFWTLASFLVYGWASEKMPWLMLHMALPLILLASMSIGKLVDSIASRRELGSKTLYYVGCLTVLFFVAAASWNRLNEGEMAVQPIEIQRQTLQTIAIALIFLGLLAVAVALGRQLGRTYSLQIAVGIFLAGLMALSIRAAWQVTYYNGDVPVEMMVYTQTSPDVGRVMKEIERVGFRTGTGKDLKVAYDSDVSWPFEWYLRDYRNRNFYGQGMPAADAPVVLVGFESDHDSKVKPALSNYIGQRYKLRWWFPEDYRGITPDGILKAIFDQTTRTKLWNYFMYRQTFNPLGSTDFSLYIRKDLVEGPLALSSTGVSQTAVSSTSASASATKAITGAEVWGSKGTDAGQFQNPKGVAVGPDGSVYVLDSGNNRVQKFSDNGRFITSWGETGQAEGQFNEPWGIAVDRAGNVYVGDTWNHRIQKFDADGNFLASWGGFANGSGSAEKGKFYGPRGIAVDQAGYVYVADTGNHRIQKFDANGNLVAITGQRGAGKGQFNEPVGLAVAPDGTLLVADTWNRRVQRLSQDLSPLKEWLVTGWESTLPTDKPFLAVTKLGMIFATDPDNNRIIQFDNGALVGMYDRIGDGGDFLRLPTGVAVDVKGRVLVVDSLNNRLVRFLPAD